MSKVLTSCEQVAKNADIKIDSHCVRQLAEQIYREITAGNLINDVFSSAPVHPQEKNDTSVDWIFVVDSLNFCFWSPCNRHWQVTWRGESYTGYFALCAAINRAIEEGVDMTDPKVYGRLTLDQLKNVLRGDDDTELLLMEERHKCLLESGQVLIDKFGGSFVTCIRQCNQSAQQLLDIIVSNFSHFRDEADYNDIRVAIYKRAQIVIGDIWSCFQGGGLGMFNDIDTITMFADYRVPQVLYYHGVLEYSDDLLKNLIDGVILENGSKEEVEIRATSVVAVAKINDTVQELLKSHNESYKCNCIIIDQYLWTYRRNRAKHLECIPFHRTQTIYY